MSREITSRPSHRWPSLPSTPAGFERFLATGDYLIEITVVCVSCGGVVAANYAAVHRGVCVGITPEEK